MKTHLDLTGSSYSEHFLMHLLTVGVPHTDPRFQVVAKDSGRVEVKILLNGVEMVDPIGGLETFMERVVEHFDRKASEKALELVSAAGLDKLRETIESADFQIREKLIQAGAVFND